MTTDQTPASAETTSAESASDAAMAEEKERLEQTQAVIHEALQALLGSVGLKYNEMMELKRHLQEEKRDMDHLEKASLRQTADTLGLSVKHQANTVDRLKRLLNTTYFGRIDFRREESDGANPIYIGIHSLHEESTGRHLVYDWRAPVSSMFYDYETGEATYEAPSGEVHGIIDRKRQYRIEDGELVFFLESALNITDSVLQEELNRNSSEKMRNIVATIQRDQNAIIRDDHSQALIIQGAAGSGKTSIALHRIAFLLYRFKEEIASSDILIISPNKVFAHYISNVLPELGEENIRETTMEALAETLLGSKYRFQSFPLQVAKLLKSSDSNFEERVRYKATPAFLEELEAYAREVMETNFTAAPVEVRGRRAEFDYVDSRHRRLGAMPFADKINALVEDVISELERNHHLEVRGADRTAVRKQITSMFACRNVDMLYKNFFKHTGRPKLFKMAAKGVWEYADVFPLIYFKILVEGMEPQEHIKHLVVDEMQDYSPVQYRVLAHLYPCNKTILGDANQSVNPLSSSTAESIAKVFSAAETVHMNKSYRSTLQISDLAQHIRRNDDLIPIERHGTEPEILSFSDIEEEIQAIREILGDFADSKARTLGLICKTQDEADTLHERLNDLPVRVQLIHSESATFEDGITITCAHLAKGLEFDEVILPHCDSRNYHGTIDRQMLYVGCTRAMHKLSLTHTGQPTAFLAGWAV